MSDWEVVQQQEAPSYQPGSDWEVAPESPEKLPQQTGETTGQSLLRAPGRIGGDLQQAAYGAARALPEMYEKSKTEIPGAFRVLMQHPGHAIMQAFAGTQELINSLAQMPKNISRYGEERLNLVPHGVTNAISRVTPQDTTQPINELFGQPQYEGEELLRGVGRNIAPVGAVANVASKLNPLRLTNKNIVKNILRTGENNQKAYGKQYKELWKDSENSNLGNALYDVDVDYNTLQRLTPKKKLEGLRDFVSNPTPESAHYAKSDLLYIQRELAKKVTLNKAERKQAKAVDNAVSSIENNMFKDNTGNLNNALLDRYNRIQKGYATEVLPYKNKHIKAFKRKEISHKQLVNALADGEFSVKRGDFHPELRYRNYIAPTLLGAAAAESGRRAYNYLTADKEASEN